MKEELQAEFIKEAERSMSELVGDYELIQQLTEIAYKLLVEDEEAYQRVDVVKDLIPIIARYTNSCSFQIESLNDYKL